MKSPTHYVDLESRLRNRKKTELRLLKHVENHDGKIENLIQIEKELDRVRKTIERIEGQFLLLNDQTNMATVCIHASSTGKFHPATTPSFVTEAMRVLSSSFKLLLVLARNLLLLIVALFPWLVTIVGIAICFPRIRSTVKTVVNY